jgi:hypothetical protein
MSLENELVEWKSEDNEENSASKFEKFSQKKRRRGSDSGDEEKIKIKNSNEDTNQIIISDATNLTEEDKRKCKFFHNL